MSNRSSLCWVALAFATASACAQGSTTRDGEEPGSMGMDVEDGVVDGQTPAAVGSETRIVRLSHEQYANTVSDLLGIAETPEQTFAPDALNGFAFETSQALQVDPRLGPQYRDAAEQLAERVVADTQLVEGLLPCDAEEQGCALEFIEGFGERAFRRPLNENESARFSALFDLGAELIGSGDDFLDGVRLTIEAMLQSPQFLYRTEVGGGEVVDGRQQLTDWEIASRLSYFLHDSMPDAQLFEAARLGELNTPEQISDQVVRLLDDPRATRKFVSFHEQLWQARKFSSISPDREEYPDAPEDIIDRVAEASQMFLSEVIEQEQGFEELLTAPYAFADEELAPLYGYDVPAGEGPLRIDFEDGERQGFLMQIGFLASNAYSIKTDPIHRGLFILRDVLCRTIPDPPPGAQMTPPPETDEPVITTRDEITLLTGQLYCPSCHSQINEPGFAFEGFDAIGQERELDNGAPVDTTGSIELDGESVEFSGAADLVQALSQSEEARACYVGRFLEFAYGRPLAEQDEGLQESLAAGSLSVRGLAEQLAGSGEFTSRSVGEVTQ